MTTHAIAEWIEKHGWEDVPEPPQQKERPKGDFVQRYERRYTGHVVELSFLQSVAGFLRGRGWATCKHTFKEVKPWEEGYEDAPYAEGFVFFQE